MFSVCRNREVASFCGWRYKSEPHWQKISLCWVSWISDPFWRFNLLGVMKISCGRDGRREKRWVGKIHRIKYLGTSAGLPPLPAIALTLWVLHSAGKKPLQAVKGQLYHPHLSFSFSLSPVLILCLYQSAGSHCRQQEPFEAVKDVMSMIKVLLLALQIHWTVPCHPQC